MRPTKEGRLDELIELVRDEVLRAERKHPPMNSPHEGYAVLLEEVDELWDLVKTNDGRGLRAAEEAIQIAAMGVRYLLNVVNEETARSPRAEGEGRR